jgi:hypothetical protein
MFRDSLCEASDEIGEWVGMLTRLARGPTRGDLAHGSLLADVFLGWGRLVFDFGWIFTLIWVPLIMVPVKTYSSLCCWRMWTSTAYAVSCRGHQHLRG